MSYIDSFKSINNEYNRRIFNIIKNEIDKAIKEANKLNINDLDKLIHVDNRLQDVYLDYAVALEIIPSKELVLRLEYCPLPELLQYRVLDYLDPLIEKARNYIEAKAQAAAESGDLEELLTKVREIEDLLGDNTVQEYNLADGIILKRTQKNTN